jgi:hypothetical protein
MKKSLPIAAGLLIVVLATQCHAQQIVAGSQQLSVESIFASDRFDTESFSPNWETEGSKFVRNTPSPTIEGAVDLVAVDPKTNQ